MWNSPYRETRHGKRYPFETLAALTYSLGMMLDTLRDEPLEHVLGENCLQRMEKEEFVYALYEVIDMLLNDTPAPKGGHFGYHEAIVAELLEQTYGHVGMELYDPEAGRSAMKAAWTSITKLLGPRHGTVLEEFDLGPSETLDLDDPQGFLSDALSQEDWRQLIVGETGLASEFLWDEDWRYDFLMDLPEQATGPIADSMGLDMQKTHGLPHTPSSAEYQMALAYLSYISWRDTVATEKDDS